MRPQTVATQRKLQWSCNCNVPFWTATIFVYLGEVDGQFLHCIQTLEHLTATFNACSR